ncbi:MAG: Ig-like domain-containing protein, partial [Opitutaceae bacterium]
MKFPRTRVLTWLYSFAQKLDPRITLTGVKIAPFTVALRGVATLLAMTCCMEAQAARVYFNRGYQASNGITYTTSTNSIQINALFSGTSLTFTSADPAATSFTGSGNDVSGVLSYITPAGTTVSIPGTISRRESSGNNVRAFYFVATAASANNAYLLPVTTTTAQNYFANLSKPANVGTNSAGVRTALEQYRVDQGNLPLITVNSVSVTEGSANPLYAVFRVSLSLAANGNVTFSPVVAGVSATVASTTNPGVGDDVYAQSTLEYSLNGITWSPVSSSVTIPQGSLYVDCRIRIVDDSVVEPVETFTLRTQALSQPANVQNNGGAFGVGTITDNDVANISPTVTLTQPANNSVFTAPGAIAMQAAAGDSDGTVTKVEFFNGGTLLGEDLVAPYQFTWNSVAAGSYTLSAKATDNSGASATSSSISVIVNAPPTVTLTTPANNAVGIAPASFTLTANAADTDGTIVLVDFYNGATKIGTSSVAPYQFIWSNVPVGSYSLTAVATDNRGATTTSALVAVRVDPANVPPTATLTAPTNGSVFPAPGNFTLVASASDSDGSVAKVEFYRGATLLGESLSAPYQFAVSGLAAGNYSFTAVATDNSGATTPSSTVSVIVNALPAVALTSPVTGASGTAPANFSLAATASDSDGTIVKVEFFNGSTLLGTSTSAPYTFGWTNVAAGSYVLTAVATDDRGATAVSATVLVEVDPANAAPTVALTSPADGTLFTPPAAISLTATAADSDGTIAKVEFFAGANKVGESLAAPYEFTWSDVLSGSYALTAKATDNLGAETVSAPVSLNVNAPSVANPQSLTTAEDIAVAITLSGSDLETPPASLIYAVATQPSQGVLTGNAPNLTYTPAGGYFGPDSFSFTVSDGTTTSSPATVSITVTSSNLPPIVDAGVDQRIGFTAGDGRNQVVLQGSVTDDGRPNPPAMVSHVWTQVSGPQPATIEQPAALTTVVRFGPPGPGKALHFGAAADSVLLPAAQNFHPSPAFSWETWFRSDSVPTGTGNNLAAGQTMMCAADGAGGVDIYLGFGSPFSPSRSLTMVVDDEGGQDGNPISYYPDGGFVSGTWYHVVATHDYVNHRTRLYVNGVLRAEKSSSKAPIARPMNMSLGRWWDGGNLFNRFAGSLDEVRIYDRELTAAEASEHYKNGLGDYGIPEANLVGGWHFDEGSGATVEDFSNAHRSTTITGAPTWVEGIAPGGGVVEAPGIYTFRLSASDSATSASDDMVVTVNTAPTVSAGENQTILNLAEGAMLSGTVTDDNVPFGPPTILWSTVAGPGQVDFASPNAAQTQASFSVGGVYILRLSVTDGWIALSDTVEVRIGVTGSVAIPPGLAAWWPANGELHEIVHGNHDPEFLPNGVSYGEGKVAQGFLFNGTDHYGRTPAHGDLDIGASTAGMTIEFWLN